MNEKDWEQWKNAAINGPVAFLQLLEAHPQQDISCSWDSVSLTASLMSYCCAYGIQNDAQEAAFKKVWDDPRVQKEMFAAAPGSGMTPASMALMRHNDPLTTRLVIERLPKAQRGETLELYWERVFPSHPLSSITVDPGSVELLRARLDQEALEAAVPKNASTTRPRM